MLGTDNQQFLFRDQILARSKPAAATPVDLYVVPQKGSVHILGALVCNAAGSGSKIRLSISPQGVTTAAEDFLYFDLPIIANDTFLLEIDTTLRVADTIRAQSSNGNLVFTLFGIVA